MKKSTTAVGLGFLASAAAAACAWAPAAIADDSSAQSTLGGQANVAGQQWTVGNLAPSSDVIAYAPAGTLWEATATVTPTQGGVPVVPGFEARAGAANYPVLWPVPTTLGINPSALPTGGSASGKLYFDVVGPTPNSVAFTSDGRDVAVWVQPPPEASAGTYSPAPAASGSSVQSPKSPAVGVAPPAVPAAPAPAPAAGSSGTPLPAGSSGTPLPAENSATATPPASGSSGTPATAASQPSAAAVSPSPAASTPAPASTPATASAPAPASTSPAPAAGSSGTPLTAPTTTVVAPPPAG